MHRHRTLHIPGVLAAALLAPAMLLLGHPAPAQEPAFPADTLSGAVVSGRAALLQSSSYAQVAGEDRIRRSADIAQLLSRFTSLQVKDYGGVGGLKTVNVRSLGSEYTALFIDGVPVDNTQNMQIDFGRFPLGDFGEVALCTTPRSGVPVPAREWGSAAAVHLSPSAPRFSPGRRDALDVRLRAGSFGMVSPGVRYGRDLGGGVVAVASLQGSRAHGRYRFHESRYIRTDSGGWAGYDTVMVRENADISSLSGSLRLQGPVAGGRGEGDGSWNILLRDFASDRGLPGPVVRRPVDAPARGDRQTDHNLLLQGGATLRPSPCSDLRLAGKYSYDYLRFRTDPDDPQALPADNRFSSHAVYLTGSGVWRAAQWLTLSLGADARYALMRSSMRGFVDPSRLSLWVGGSALAELGPFRAEAILMYEHHSDFFDRRKASAAGGFRKEDALRRTVVPGLRLHYGILRPSTSARHIVLDADLSVRRAFRMPTFNDLYYTQVGNASLSPEDALLRDAGLRFAAVLPSGCGVRLGAVLNAYYNTVKDKIVAVPTASQFRWTMYNIGRVETVGAELRLDVSARLWDCLDARAEGGYTFQRSADMTREGSSTYGGQVPYIPLHSGTASVAMGWRGWELGFGLLANGRRWSTSANVPEYMLDPFATLDLSLGRDLHLRGGGALSLRLDIGNLASSRYEIVPRYPMPGAHAYVTVGYRM